MSGHVEETARVRAGRRLAPGFAAVLAAGALAGTTVPIASYPAFAKTPGATHCYGQWCHRVSTLDEMEGMVGRIGFLKASFYDDCKVDRFNTCDLTSSGEVFHPNSPDNAASPIFPDGTVILAYYPQTQKAAVLRVNSAGPYYGDRRLDVSRAAADRLGFREKGVAELMVTVVKAPEPDEARYKKRRSYERVPGYLGKFSTFEAAHDAARTNLKMDRGVVVGALDEGETTPLPPPESDGEEISRMAAIEIVPVPPRTIGVLGATFVIAPLAPGALKEDGSVRVLKLAPDVEELLAASLAGGAALVHSAARTLAVRDAAAPVAAAAPSDAGARNADALQVAALEINEASREARRPHETVAAREPALVDFAVSARVKGRFADFIELARRKARMGLAKPSAPAPETRSWSERLSAFIADARSKARAGVSRSGTLTRFAAELRLKAQPQRDDRD